MTLAYRAVVSVIQLIFFVPGFGLGILLASRHGFGKSSGWYFLIAFTLLRVIGAICEIIASLHFSLGVYITALVCNSIGLAPLTLLCLGMLSRANDTSSWPIPARIFKLISLFSLAGLALGIAGGSLQTDRTSTGAISVRPETKAAIIIFFVVYFFVVAILCILSTRVSSIAAGEKRLLIAVALSVPFIAVRLVYALIGDFAHLRSFSLVSGSTTIYLCMAVIMEIVVVIIIIAFGLTLRIIPKGEPVDGESQRELHDLSGSHSAKTTEPGQAPAKKSERSKAMGPISWLYFAGKDLYRSRQH